MARDSGGEAGISNGAVRHATGRSWAQWLRLLDRAGGKRMTHAELVAEVGQRAEVSGWWRQMVAVGYEQARGKRAKHERPEGFEITRSRTLPVPISRLFQAWTRAAVRQQWLPGDPLTVRKRTRNRSIRALWSDGKTRIEVYFHEKGKAKSSVTVQHGRLPNADAAERMSRFWGNRLEALRETLTT